MSRAVSRLVEACSRLSITQRSQMHYLRPPPTSSILPPGPIPASTIIEKGFPSNGTYHFPNPSASVELPSLENPQQVYTFPTLNRTPMVAPGAIITEILEKLAPTVEKGSLIAPGITNKAPMWLSPRLLTIRRKKMKKHKRRRRYDRDFFKYQKYHREKKLKAEREFQKRMKSLLTELEAFNPEKYVKDTIKMANKEWQDELAPTGRKLYPHWSRLMSLEQLYGLPKSEYIDKRAGLPTPEEAEQIKALKEKYAKLYRKK
ncbi:hypothetical protein CAEBREN_04990 [Caenorhabditis brenneri]|uniref:Mitochondrial mRNA-processing protein COX24 C-terminal domain-containing protein n=1 Tax=Caenorhabditis brenneri TaxID=135651 RepID=G0MQC2_CAEBE|nr:hypothetical protein CAEBREN_04990 [Caenorhabditis brenneri]